jgi:hypothetical protein
MKVEGRMEKNAEGGILGRRTGQEMEEILKMIVERAGLLVKIIGAYSQSR